MPIDPIAALFDARSVAVVGASPDLETINGRTIKYLQRFGYQGRVIPITPRHREIGGLACHASVLDVDGNIDLAILSVAAARVPAIIDECAAKGIRSAIVYSSGYAETGPAGRQAQEALRARAAERGVRLCGPNSMGCINLHNGLTATFSAVLEKSHRAGPLALVSQSGAYGAYIMAQARELGLGFGLFATTGNECDIGVGELVEHALKSEQTRAVLVYVEQIHDAASFARAARLAIDVDKPIIAIKVGRGVAGARAAASHTGALAGSSAAYDGFFEQHGCVLVNSVEAMLDIAQLIQAGSRPRGSRIGVLSMSGGAAVLIGDAAEAAGLCVPELPEDAQARLRELIPFAGVSNPIDATAHLFNAPHAYKGFLDAIIGHDIDTLILFFGQMIGYVEGLGMRVVRESAMARAATDKPMLMVGMPGDGEPARILAEAGIPVFTDPTRAVNAVAALARLAGFRQRDADILAETPAPIEPPVHALDSEHAAKVWLAARGLPVALGRLASGADDAVAAAEAIGYPVVVKIASPRISHKSDIGGVRLDLRSAAEVRQAYSEIALAAAQRGATCAIQVSVQPMVGPGVELLVGLKRDPTFGPMIVCASGGTLTEVMRDFSIRQAPVSVAEAHRMLASLRGFAVLQGVRGSGPSDIEAAAAVISHVSRIGAAAASWLSELDVNPLIVLANGQGVVVADARVVQLGATMPP